MAPIVALYNHNGLTGSGLLNGLIPYHRNGKIRLIVTHREGSNVSSIPRDCGIELRALDLATPNEALNRAAIRGVNVFIAPTNATEITRQKHLIDLFAESPDFWSFIPSEFGCNWVPSELVDLQALADKDDVAAYARQRNVAITIIKTGLYPEMALTLPALISIEPKRNAVGVYRQSLDRVVPFTSVPYIAQVVAQLIVERQKAISNKIFDLIEHEVTGQQIVDYLTELHGKSTSISVLSEQEWQVLYEAGGLQTLGAGFRKKWGETGYLYHGERVLPQEGEISSFKETLITYSA